jgi:hypothetical protein
MKHPEVTEDPAEDKDIVEFGPEVLDEDVAYIRLGFDRFVESGGYKGLNINLGALHVAVKSWHDDLYRYRKYHKIAYPNKHKQAAFLMRWITKTKPIFPAVGQTAILPHQDYSAQKYLTVNESFAVALGLRLMGIDVDMLESHVVGKLIYDFYYRSVNAKHDVPDAGTVGRKHQNEAGRLLKLRPFRLGVAGRI